MPLRKRDTVCRESPIQQVEVSAFNQMILRHSQSSHEVVSLPHSVRHRLILSKHHLEFEKIPKTLNLIEMNAGAAGEE